MFVSEALNDRVRQINDAFPKCIAADKILSKLRKEKRAATDTEQRVVDEAERLFFSASRSTPTAARSVLKARPEDAPSPRPFLPPPPDSIEPLGVRRRHAPKSR